MRCGSYSVLCFWTCQNLPTQCIGGKSLRSERVVFTLFHQPFGLLHFAPKHFHSFPQLFLCRQGIRNADVVISGHTHRSTDAAERPHKPFPLAHLPLFIVHWILYTTTKWFCFQCTMQGCGASASC